MNKNIYEDKIYSIFNFIEDRIEENFSLKNLAFQTNYTPFHFHRIFQNAIGEAPLQYRKRLKLEKAAFDLKILKKQIIDIALDSGYETHESFTRAFKKQFQISPKEYRNKFHIENRKLDIQPEFILEDKIKIIRVKSFPVIYKRYIGPYEDCPGPDIDSKIWNEFLQEAKKITNKKIVLGGICHDDPEITEQKKIRFDLMLILENESKIFPNQKMIQEGTYAVATHFGNYKNLGSTYEYMLSVYPNLFKKKIRNIPAFEIYLNPFSKNSNLSKTDVFIPLED